MSRVHIIGAGLSGLAAAVRLIEHDVPVTVYEGAGQAGGRCRTFFDKHLEREIDNG
ncbi:MAG: NAD(P)-binding protein, partial [Oricola sp.]|nr:NAD(P)-binding protein [Oricola sp.]